MDGTRGKPPGRTAENWSRKDGIRAGSVSGPWRSAPRAAPAPASGPAITSPSAVGPSPTSWPPAGLAPPERRTPELVHSAPAPSAVLPARERRVQVVPEFARRVEEPQAPALTRPAAVEATGPVRSDAAVAGSPAAPTPSLPRPALRIDAASAAPEPEADGEVPAKPRLVPPARVEMKAAPAAAVAREARGSKSAALRLPVALAGCLALGLVAAALMLRPEPGPAPVAAPAPLAAAPQAEAAEAAATPAQPAEGAAAVAPQGLLAKDALAAPPPPEPEAEPPLQVLPAAEVPAPAPDISGLPEASVPPEALPRATRPRARPAPPEVSAADVAAARVMIRIGPDMDERRRAEILAILSAAGFHTVEVQPVPFAVERPRLGYFRAADRTIAEALAGLISPVAGKVAVRSYDDLLADPAPGRLDLWLGG